MTGGAFLRRAARVPAAALAAGLLAGAPPAIPREAGEAVVLSSSEIAHVLARMSRDIAITPDGAVYPGSGLIVLPVIAFESGSDRPTAASQAQIAALAGALKRIADDALRDPEFGGVAIYSVEGPVDGAESDGGRESLSLRRARRVVRSLVEEHGVLSRMARACGHVPREGPRLVPDDSAVERWETVRLNGLTVTDRGPPAGQAVDCDG